MDYFNFNISPLIITLLSGTLLFALLSAIFGMAPMRRVARYGRRVAKRDADLMEVPDDKLPSVSIIVYARNAQPSLREFVESLERQNYPKFEIVIVNDGSTDMTREIADTLAKEYDNIKYTFVSDTAKNVSRIKVAYALGIKAADYDVIVTTAANCRATSDNWLRLLCTPLASPDTGISLGYSYVPQEKQTDKARWERSFDATVASSQWLGAALAGHPFRGDQYNLAFRRKLFFDHKGYASSTALNGGHDDIFINEVARDTQAAVVLHPDAHVIVDWESDQIKRLYRDARERRIFISAFLKTGAFRLQGFNSLCIWLMLLFSVAAIVISSPNMFPVATVALILLTFWGYGICLYRRTATILHRIRLWWSVPLFWILRPFASANRHHKAHTDNARHYTWSVGMKP